MHVECAACHHVLEFSAAPPAFCCHCGHAVAASKPPTTIDFDLDAPTLPPSDGSATIQCSVPDVVGGYRLLRPLGSGGMGTVYEAEDPCSGCHVALKLIAPEFTASKDAMERFRQEGRLASTIAHPRCVFVLAADEEAGQPYIALELMPGATLQDLVKEKGSLPVAEAVAKIGDVIEGLQEVHRLGLIHRDVKPSNCFLEADGHVKIGDFGLCKSLVRESHLTRTGSFLGTPLYASPEQIKMERVDRQSDVYAVAATLYFLLTGRAPHQTGDAAATVARIVSDPVPSMRSTRPDLPRALDRVVLRGLERERKHRWRNLDEFRVALAPFLRRRLSIGGIGIRIGAYLVDVLLFKLLFGVPLALRGIRSDDPAWLILAGVLVQDAVWLFYFTLLEGIWGCSLGKRWLRLRVCAIGTGADLGLGKAFLRTISFHVLVNLGWPIAAVLRFIFLGPHSMFSPLIDTYLPFIWFTVGILALSSTMRKGNGYRGIHDFLSGSRVVQLPWPWKRRKWRSQPQELAISQPKKLPERIGHFVIKGAIRWTGEEGILLAEDAVLARKVWLWLRPSSAPPMSEARREIARPARLRWLASGHTTEQQWDAFLAAPAGWSLATLIAQEQRLSWAEIRPLLEQLTDELVAASADETVPDRLTADQVWVEPDGRVQLIDAPFQEAPASAPCGVAPEIHRRALELLGQVAVLTLEGHSRPAGRCAEPIRAPIPEHAAQMLDRLLGVGKSYDRVEEFKGDLMASADQPIEVTRGLRAGHLLFQGTLLLLGYVLLLLAYALLSLAGVVPPFPEENPDAKMVPIAIFAGMLWVAWGCLFRGGLTLGMLGIVLVDANGRLASRVRSGWRALLLWLPPLLAIGLLLLAKNWDVLAYGWLVLLVLYFLVGLLWPGRGPHDRLAGTFLVPK
ncbi:MAG TPA: protein kinase [Gemmataceae bacterium]|nr:protein kinase [Gemmataceae bacterium]